MPSVNCSMFCTQVSFTTSHNIKTLMVDSNNSAANQVNSFQPKLLFTWTLSMRPHQTFSTFRIIITTTMALTTPSMPPTLQPYLITLPLTSRSLDNPQASIRSAQPQTLSHLFQPTHFLSKPTLHTLYQLQPMLLRRTSQLSLTTLKPWSMLLCLPTQLTGHQTLWSLL